MKRIILVCAVIAFFCFNVNAQNDPTNDNWSTTGAVTSMSNGSAHLLNTGSNINPELRIFSDDGLGTSSLSLRDLTANQMRLEKYTAAGASLIDINPFALDGTSAATFRFFRLTNTSGPVFFEIFKGDGSATVQSRLSANGNSFFNINSGNVGIGTAAPSNKLSVVGDADVSGHLGVGTSDTTSARMLTVVGNRGVGASITDTSAAGTGLIGQNNHIATANDGIGVVGLSAIYDFYGFGGVMRGGYVGCRGAVFPLGGANQTYFGVQGIANGGTGVLDASANFGVYGFADGADPTQNGGSFIGDWAVYAAGEAYSTVAWTASDERYKKNVKDLPGDALQVIMDLEPKSYEFVQGDVIHTSGGTQYGFLAQDLEKIIPEAVKNTVSPIIDANEKEAVPEKNKTKSLKVVNLDALLPFIVKGMQEQQEEIEELRGELANKDAEIEDMKRLVRQIDQDLQQCCLQHQTGSNHGNGSSNGTAFADKPHLAQNVPNPFSERTVIKYYLPSNGGKGKVEGGMIRVMDLKGVVLWEYNLVESGYGQIEIDANTFAPATYIYEMIVSDERIDSKKMVIE